MAEPLLQHPQQTSASLPQRALFVWNREEFPFHARLAIESLLVNAPDLYVELHLFGEPPETSPHFRAIRRRSRVIIEQHGRLANNATLRGAALALLHSRGGLLFDFGSLVTAPLHPLLSGSEAVSVEHLPDPLSGRRDRGFLGRLCARGAELLARLMWALCPTTMQPELERFSSFRWLNNCWLTATIGRALIVAPAGSAWVLSVDHAPPPDHVVRLGPPHFLEANPIARMTDRLFDGGPWPVLLRLFADSSRNNHRSLVSLGPKQFIAMQRRNRLFRAAYGIMCANGLQRYALHSKNSSNFPDGHADSGVGDAISSPDLKSLS
jgi:hypothetical protein